MLVIIKLIMLGFGVMYASTLLYVVFDIIDDIINSIYSNSKKRNRVHFYVARDNGGLLYLYLGKPERAYSTFVGICVACIPLIEDEYDFKKSGIKADDFKDLKWEDEPVEVFVNMEE